MNKLIKNWLPLLVWAGLIFFLSHQPNLKSGLPVTWDFVLRKLAHILEYAILAFLLIRAFKEHQISQKKVLCLTVILAILYAISDEWHQAFVFGREGTWRDVLIDSLGIFLTVFLYRKSKNQRRSF
jgi:VanZ family protein